MLKLTEDKVDNFNKEGYIHLKNVIPSELLVKARNLAIELKHQYKSRVGEPRHNGSGNFWNGLELASTLNPNLWECYTADYMFEIASKFLGSKHYLFNDKVVVKLHKEYFRFYASLFPNFKKKAICHQAISNAPFISKDKLTNKNK